MLFGSRDMPVHIPSWGKTPEELLELAAVHETSGTIGAKIKLQDFQRLRDENGHVVIDLPGLLCGFLRQCSGCRCAEVLHTASGADAVIVGVFDGASAVNAALTALARASFDFGRFALPCPALTTSRGSLRQLLAPEVVGKAT